VSTQRDRSARGEGNQIRETDLSHSYQGGRSFQLHSKKEGGLGSWWERRERRKGIVYIWGEKKGIKFYRFSG